MLLDTGKVKVKAKITFKPAATGGDVAGDPSTDPRKDQADRQLAPLRAVSAALRREGAY